MKTRSCTIGLSILEMQWRLITHALVPLPSYTSISVSWHWREPGRSNTGCCRYIIRSWDHHQMTRFTNFTCMNKNHNTHVYKLEIDWFCPNGHTPHTIVCVCRKPFWCRYHNPLELVDNHCSACSRYSRIEIIQTIFPIYRWQSSNHNKWHVWYKTLEFLWRVLSLYGFLHGCMKIPIWDAYTCKCVFDPMLLMPIVARFLTNTVILGPAPFLYQCSMKYCHQYHHLDHSEKWKMEVWHRINDIISLRIQCANNKSFWSNQKCSWMYTWLHPNLCISMYMNSFLVELITAFF